MMQKYSVEENPLADFQKLFGDHFKVIIFS